MAHRIYGRAQSAEHRKKNLPCELCSNVDPLTRVQANDTRTWDNQGKNRVKIDCTYYFDIAKQTAWGSTTEQVQREIDYLHSQGITIEWHNKRVCDACYRKFNKAIQDRLRV